MIQDFARLLVTELDELIESRTSSVMRGLDQEQYHRTMGFVTGLQQVRQRVLELAKKDLEDEER